IAPYITPWSVTAACVKPSSLRRLTRGMMRLAPSRRLYSICKCRWAKDMGFSFGPGPLLGHQPAVGIVVGDFGQHGGNGLLGFTVRHVIDGLSLHAGLERHHGAARVAAERAGEMLFLQIAQRMKRLLEPEHLVAPLAVAHGGPH